HLRRVAHGEQTPPQSTSVSFWFCVRSVQDAVWQSPPAHTPELQSETFAQALPAEQVGQAVPPQSTPVSVPFFVASLQSAARQLRSRHTLLAQSLSTSQ